MNTSRTRFLIASALLIPVLLYWGLGGSPNSGRGIAETGLGEQMDYFLEQADMREWREDGSLMRTLQTVRLEHFPEQQHSVLAEPVSYLYRTNGSQIQVTADQGTVPDDNSRADLAGNVVVHDNPVSVDSTRLETEQLTIYPQQNQADSDVLVTIRHSEGVTRGIGMHADLDAQTMDLHSQVKGIFNHAP